jgi:hypothetical protein
MEQIAFDIQKKVNNMKRLKPQTQKKLITKYSQEMGIPENYFTAIMDGNLEYLIEQFNHLKDTNEGKNLNLDKINLNNLNEKKATSLLKNVSKLNNSDTDDTESDEDDDPITNKVNLLKEGNLRANVNKYIKDNNLFSKTENLVILLDPVLKELFNLDVDKIELKELVKKYN